MACASCNKNRKGEGYIQLRALETPPFGANDMQLYDAASGEVHRFGAADWAADRHKLLLFFPAVYTPVCQSEMGALNDWLPEFEALGCDVFAATADPIHAVKDWYENEPALADSKYRVISSYMLPSRLNVTDLGKAKRASVFMMANGDVVVQEHFLKVGRSLKELHRMLYAYTQDSYCAEGWEDPSDGFLNDTAEK